MLPRFLAPLVGLALGGLLGWRVFAPAPSPLAASLDQDASASLRPFRLAAWDWRQSALPPTLSPADSAAAIAAWLALRGPDGGPPGFALRADTLHALLARLPATEYPRLLTALAARPDPDDQRLFGIAFNLLVSLDPAAAARWAATAAARPGFYPSFWAGLAVQAWARLDLGAATAWVLALGNPDLTRQLGAPLLAELAKTDPGTALRAFGPTLWQDGEGYWTLGDTLNAWARREPAAALSWLLAQPNQQRDQLAFWIGGLAATPSGQPTPPPELFALLDAIAAQPAFAEQHSAKQIVMGRIARQDPHALLAWLDQHATADQRDELLRRLVSPLWRGRDSPATSLSLVLALPLGTDRTRLLGEHLKTLAERDPAAALAWINAHDEPAVRASASQAHAGILVAIARDEPATAIAEWRDITDPKVKNAALGPIIEAWSQKDPGAALRWLQTQPTELAANGFNAAYKALYPWSLQEPEAALRWAEAQPASKATYLQALAGDQRNKADRAAVSDLYAKITDPALRAEVLTAHVREWLTKDHPAAQAWLESTSALPPEQAAALLAPPPAP